MKCPICGNELEVVEEVRNLPLVGKVLLFTIYCDNCGYRKSDVVFLEDRGPKRYEYEVKNKKDLYTKVIRSSTGKIIIPDFGVDIDPGIAAQGFITNIEGILYRVEEIIKMAIRWKINDIIEKTKNDFSLLLNFLSEEEAKEVYKKIASDDDLERLSELYGVNEKILRKLRDNILRNAAEDFKALKKALEILNQVNLAKEGKVKFKIIVEDIRGNSAILSKEAKVKEI